MLVPMRQEGVEVRGITQPDGTAEFCEVFFDNARCPKDAVVGGVNNGWKVANSTLAFRRGQSATTGYRRFAEEYRLLVEVATDKGVIDDPLVRQRLMEYYTKIQILKINGLRNLSATLAGGGDMGTIALGATNKMFWSEMHKAAMEQDYTVEAYPGAEGMLIDAGPSRAAGPARLRDSAARGLSRQPDDVVVLLLALGDDLGWHQPDPAQHRRRTCPRPPQGTQAPHRVTNPLLVNQVRTRAAPGSRDGIRRRRRWPDGAGRA